MPAPTKNFKRTGGFILSTAADPQRSVDQGMLDATAVDLEAGTVCGKLTASGRYVPYDPAAAATGAETFAGILLDGQIVSAAPTRHVFVTRDAEVKAPELVYVNALDAAQLAAVEAAMAEQGIIVRPGI